MQRHCGKSLRHGFSSLLMFAAVLPALPVPEPWRQLMGYFDCSTLRVSFRDSTDQRPGQWVNRHQEHASRIVFDAHTRTRQARLHIIQRISTTVGERTGGHCINKESVKSRIIIHRESTATNPSKQQPSVSQSRTLPLFQNMSITYCYIHAPCRQSVCRPT